MKNCPTCKYYQKPKRDKSGAGYFAPCFKLQEHIQHTKRGKYLYTNSKWNSPEVTDCPAWQEREG